MTQRLFLPFFLLTAFVGVAQVSPGNPNAIPVEFRFLHVRAAADSGVGVNGSMNGWTGGVFRMREIEPNLYKTSLDLLPLTYEYKFVTFTDTVGQAGVTGYYTDPLNPRLGGPFNNSFITVQSPMIYYLLPKNGATITNLRPAITANISWANNRELDLTSLIVKVDNATIPNAADYYNAITRVFSYLPPSQFSLGTHSVYIKCATTNGDTASLISSFNIIENTTIKPYTFTFDSKSPNFNFLSPINRVDIKGSFNQNGQNLMTDPDGDGIFSYPTELTMNEANEYTIIVNTGYYMNDPDNPLLSSNHRTVAVRKKFSLPYFTDFTPAQGEWYTYPATTSVTINGKILKGDTVITVNQSSIKAIFQGNTIPITTQGIPDGYSISAVVPVSGPGRYAVEFSGRDIYGNSAASYTVHFGVKPAAPESGFVYYDGENDDKGTGTYKLPAGVDTGAADIRSIKILASQNRDSLLFEIEMEKIHPMTRVALMIEHDINSPFTEAPSGAKLMIPDWNNKGAYITLALPGSAYLDTAIENRVILSREAPVFGVKPQITVIGNSVLRFSIPLSALQSVLGSFNDSWHFLCWSYLKNGEGTVKVGSSLGGEDIPEATNVYDIAFVKSTARQELLLKNFRAASQIGGSQIAAIGKDERGATKIAPALIHPMLGQIPAVTLFAGGGIVYTDSVTVWGKASLPQGTQVTLFNNSVSFSALTGSDSIFAKRIPLIKGNNTIHAECSTPVGLSFSSTIVYTYEKDTRPVVKIGSGIAGGIVTLSADSSYDPSGLPLNYRWSQDAKNPSQVSLSSTTNATVSFTQPALAGEYYFTVAAANGTDTTKGRTVILSKNGAAAIPDYATWHPAWLDTSILYSIFVRTFDQSGTFNGVKNRLAELKDLGVDVLWLLPVHPTTGDLGPDNPGYATTDYMGVLPQYGTKAEFKSLLDAAHSYGIKVILDQVIQHTSDLHPFMKDAKRFKQYSPYYPFYYWDANGNFQYLFTWVALPSINFSRSATRDYLLRVAKHWVRDIGVDGYRCDVAWAINDLRPEGPAFWQQWRRELKAIRPDLFLMAEADAKYERYFDKKFDVAYDWNLFTLLRSIVSGTGTVAALDSAVQFFSNPSFPQHARPYRFMENQDEQRFFEAFGLAKTKLASALMFSVPGIPSLYAGQEVGELTFRGNIRWNDPYSLRSWYKKLIALRRSTPALHSGDCKRVQNSKPDAVYSLLRRNGNSNAIMNFNFSNSQQTVTLNVPVELLAFDSTATFYLNDHLNKVSYQVTGSQLRNYQLILPGNTAQLFILSDVPLETENEQAGRPKEFSVSQNYPNPFNPSTAIRYSLPVASHVTVAVYNMLGEKIDVLADAVLADGMYEAVWNAQAFASGVYFISLEAKPVHGGEGFRTTKKVIMLK